MAEFLINSILAKWDQQKPWAARAYFRDPPGSKGRALVEEEYANLPNKPDLTVPYPQKLQAVKQIIAQLYSQKSEKVKDLKLALFGGNHTTAAMKRRLEALTASNRPVVDEDEMR